MSTEVYQKLAQYLDSLPAGNPPTESDIGLRILENLFILEQAELALPMKAKPEPAARIAGRAGMEESLAVERLNTITGDGLILSMEPPGSPMLCL